MRHSRRGACLLHLHPYRCSADPSARNCWNTQILWNLCNGCKGERHHDTREKLAKETMGGGGKGAKGRTAGFTCGQFVAQRSFFATLRARALRNVRPRKPPKNKARSGCLMYPFRGQWTVTLEVSNASNSVLDQVVKYNSVRKFSVGNKA